MTLKEKIKQRINIVSNYEDEIQYQDLQWVLDEIEKQHCDNCEDKHKNKCSQEVVKEFFWEGADTEEIIYCSDFKEKN
jgi:hypothetical protein